MKDVRICRPRLEDREQLGHFFKIVLIDTYEREGLGELNSAVENEVEVKKEYLKSDFDSHGSKRYFLLAKIHDNVVGTIEFGPASDLIIKCTEGRLKGLVEVGTVFVKPDYQRQGIGNILLNAMCSTLQGMGIEEFCLDSGYKNAQKMWKKKFGKPDYLLKNYWGEGFNHMIWKKKVADLNSKSL